MSTKLLAAGSLTVVLILATCLLASAPAPQPRTQPVDFATQIRPILEKRCQPCHFAGGKVYGKMPFDQPQTIHTLGEKMFTRIKDPKEQAVLRAFLAQGQREMARRDKGNLSEPEPRSDLGREIASERETAYLLRSKAMRQRLLEARERQEGISFDEVRRKLGI